MNALMMAQQNESWRDAYRVALFEPDKNKLPSRIAVAEQQIAVAALQLLNTGECDITERSAINVALFALQALRSSLDSAEDEERQSGSAVA